MEKHELKPHVREQIDKGLDAVVEEFEEVASAEEVREIGKQPLEEILPDSRIDEFVPALVNSNTRAELLNQAQSEGDDRDEEPPEGTPVAPGRTGAARVG